MKTNYLAEQPAAAARPGNSRRALIGSGLPALVRSGAHLHGRNELASRILAPGSPLAPRSSLLAAGQSNWKWPTH